jgi:Zincin-like metallopeptidase
VSRRTLHPVRRFGPSHRPDSPDSPDSPAGPVGKRPRHRDRHGRGIRGSLAPVEVPLSLTRAARFDEHVLDAVEQVERAVAAGQGDSADPALGERLAAVEYGIEEVPPEPVLTAAESGLEPLRLGRAEPATDGNPARVVLYRRPLELRTPDPRDRAALVHEIVVEHLADLLGVLPDELDPPDAD